MIKILLAQTYEIAQNVKASATVEAEYGNFVVKGEKQTLAHHANEYVNFPAPCVQEVEVLESGDTILVSHLDLDTLGGIMALTGKKTGSEDFWKAAEFIDLNGPHHLYKFKEFENIFNAYIAFSQKNRINRYDEVTDITNIVNEHIDILTAIIDGDEILINEGILWAKDIQEKTKQSLIDENEKVRIFAGPHFTAASYYSEKFNKNASVTISFNTMNKAITIATSDSSINCSEVIKELFGPEAGGHAGIGGSPRGLELTFNDFNKTVEYINNILQ